MVMLFFLGMARVKVTAKVPEGVETSAQAEDQNQRSEGEEDLSQVDADLSELMGRDKPETTLRFGNSLVIEALTESYIEKGYFNAGVCRCPEGEKTPDPHDGECVVFRDFFVAGLRFPLDSLVP